MYLGRWILSECDGMRRGQAGIVDRREREVDVCGREERL
jgi:hypothetical protein